MMRGLAAGIGARSLGICGTVGGISRMSWEIALRLAPPRVDGPELMRNLYSVGVKSFPIIMLTAVFVGAIMVIQSGVYVQKYGADGLLGWGAGFAVLREVSPLLIGL